MATEPQEGTAAEGHASGLPQFDFQWWPGQIAWFLIIFFLMLAFMRLFTVPRVGGAMDERERRIADDIAQARQLKDEADAQAQAAAAEMALARGQAQKLAADARATAQGEIAAKLAEEEAKLAKTGAEAEARINAARDAAMTNVGDIARDTAQAIIEKLTGRAASPAEFSAAPRAQG